MGRILVTGAGGFVGRHLTRALAARGDQVHGFGLGPAPEDLPLAEWRSGDVLDAAAVGSAVESARPVAVVHLAGQSSAARSFEHPVETYRANVLGSWMLLDAVRAHAPTARVLLVGSGEAYGPQPEGAPVSEGAPFRPVSPYALSKAAADAAGAAFALRHGIALIRTRSFGHTGPGQSPTFVVPSLARQIARIERDLDDPVLRVGNVHVTRDLTDVRDVVEAYARLLEGGRPGAAYNVCRGEGVPLSAIIEQLSSLSRREVRVEVDPARFRPVDLPWLVGDPAVLRRDTGWVPGIPLRRTLEDILGSWREAPA